MEPSAQPAKIRTEWPLAEAKARFSELFRKARNDGPQRVTRQGKEAVIVVSEEEYEELRREKKDPASIVEFFQSSPLHGLDLDFERDPGQDRELDL